MLTMIRVSMRETEISKKQSYVKMDVAIFDVENLANKEIKLDFSKLEEIYKRHTNKLVKYAIVGLKGKGYGVAHALSNYNYNIIATNGNCDIALISVLFKHILQYKQYYFNKSIKKYIFIITRDGDYTFAVNTIKQIVPNVYIILITAVANKYNVKIASNLVHACDKTIILPNMYLYKENGQEQLFYMQQLAKQLKSKYSKQQINMLISYLLS